MHKKERNINLAVSEILGAILLLGIVVVVFSVITYTILSVPPPDDGPIVEISGVFFENHVVLTHRWGEPLSLDTEVFIVYKGSNNSLVVGDYLDGDSRSNGLWDLGEKLFYPVPDDFDYVAHPDINISLFDNMGNNIVFIGNVDYDPTCDMSIDINVNESYPREYDLVSFTITVSNNCIINASGTVVEFILPEGLTYYDNVTTSGSYDSVTGLWNVGRIGPEQHANLTVTATVGSINYSSFPTQLALILDGSDSISPPSWTLMKNGISAALSDGGYFPHDGTSELTVVQFGGKKPAYAQLEVSPTKITESSANTVRNTIENMNQIGGKTPTSCGVYLAADALSQSIFFDPSIRQIFLLVTDGNPTHCCDCCDGDYEDDQCSGSNGPKNEVSDAVNYSVSLLDLTTGQDEFDALAVELMGEGHSYFLKEDVVWPFPGYYAPPFIPFPHRGWVRNVSSWEEFGYAINEAFASVFNSGQVKTTIVSLAIADPRFVNNEASVEITVLPNI
jgi:uncharacterized repeat protein (TIGR01451 family)